MSVEIHSSTPSGRTAVSATNRRARVAVALLFLTNGMIFANMLPRYPGIKADLGLTNAQYGLAIAAFPAGAIAAGLAAGALIRRFRSSRVAVAGTILTGIGVFLAGLAPSWLLLAGTLLLAGASDAVTDVAQNAHGLRVQRRYGRSILNGFHAIWSIGAVGGGLMGTAAVALGLSRGVHLGISATLLAGVALVAHRFLLPGPEPADGTADSPGTDNVPDAAAGESSATSDARAEPAPSMVRTVLLLGALVLISIAGIVVEDAGGSWGAVYLSGSLGASAAVAPAGYIALVGAQFLGRTLGDRLVDRFGQRAIARGGGFITAVGMGGALAFPTVPGTIAGFALAGFGVATLIPAAMHAADELPGLRPGTGLAMVSWLMRVGFLAAPPLVGLVADATSLRIGLLSAPLAGAIALALAGVLSNQRNAAETSGSSG